MTHGDRTNDKVAKFATALEELLSSRAKHLALRRSGTPRKQLASRALEMNEIGEALHDEVAGSAIPAMLQRLERKGFVERTQGERGFLYSPAVPEEAARRSALSQVVKVFLNGSPGSAAAALLGMQDELNENELDELEKLIADTRQGRKS